VTHLHIVRAGPLVGRASLPGDLHIGQQALLWAALAHGESSVEGLAPRRDHQLLVAALRELGVTITEEASGYRVSGVGVSGLRIPGGALRAGDSESTLEILVSLLAGQHFGTRVEGSGHARTHSLRTLLGPLRERGAHVRGTREEDGDVHAPVAVAPLLPDELLESVEIGIPFGDAATKLGLLLSGLYTRGVTAISETMLSRDHAERALVALGAPVQTAAGMTLLDTSHGAQGDALGWPGFSWRIPGDFTLASYLVAAALCVEGSDVLIEGVGLNPTRTAFLEALRGTGARVEVTPRGDLAGNEPVGVLRARASTLSSIRVGGERGFRLLDEVPALLALSLRCRTRLTVRDIALLRGRSPDALKATVDLLSRFGVGCTVYEDGVEIDPPATLRGAHVTSDVPPAQALLACILGLSADGETQIDDAERLDACYPGLVSTLSSLGARIERREDP
jgi:3-phosphoshikimate 1-carboxyvinyltransferase